MKRSHSIDVDRDFDVFCDVTKFSTLPDGRRLVRGVASGVLEDRDGERVSARAVAEMAAQPAKGLKVVAGTHDQNWTNEIGDVVELRHDGETNELIADAILPPAGEDPLADKACKRLEAGERLGWSIGGKCTRAFKELVEDPRGGIRKRKVLDGVLLKHLCLTEKPAYEGSVVAMVAKTVGSIDLNVDDADLFDEPAGQEQADAEEIAKAAKPKAKPADPDEQASEAPQATEGNEPDAGAASPPAATGDTAAVPPTQAGADPAAAGADVPSDAQEAQGLPMAQRHLACPNCGEEFAAPLPDGDPSSEDTDPEPKNGGDAEKTTKETPMDVKAELAKIRGLLDDVAKTVADEPTTEAAAPAAEVEKTTEPSDLERMLAASHAHASERFEAVEKHATEGFELVAGAVQKLAEQIQAMPQGRRSIARVIPPNSEVEKTATETDDVMKQADEAAETGDLTKALRLRNQALYGIR